MKKLVIGSLVLAAACVWPLLAEAPLTLPPAVAAQLKSGKQLGKVWINPRFDVTQGFVVDKVNCTVDNYYADALQYFPVALRRIAMDGSPNVLDLTVVELKVVTNSGLGYETGTVGVEGTITGPDGTLLMAFTTREEVENRENERGDLAGAMDKIVWSLSKVLGPTYERALEVKRKLAMEKIEGGAVPPPPAPEKPLPLDQRLMRLEDLKQKGLITQEEYEEHKKELLKNL